MALMFHRAEDLLGEMGPSLWERCSAWARRVGCKLGVSCYSPIELRLVGERFPVEIAQLPGNAFDQRLRADLPPSLSSIEIHVRSAFLQGLLLLSEAEASRRVPRAAGALRRWHQWLRMENLDAVPAALSLVKSFPHVTHCIVGVDCLSQLESVAAAWHAVPARTADALAVSDLDVIDPRRWPARA
jgi:aryl-alcohol dehydrogenase-like predicted oxidoreductase